MARAAQAIALTAFIAVIWVLISEIGKPISLFGIGGVVAGLGYLLKSL